MKSCSWEGIAVGTHTRWEPEHYAEEDLRVLVDTPLSVSQQPALAAKGAPRKLHEEECCQQVKGGGHQILSLMGVNT